MNSGSVGGSFIVTNAINPNQPQGFFNIQTP